MMPTTVSRAEARKALARRAQLEGQNVVASPLKVDAPASDPDGKYVEVEWIGEKSPLENPVVAYKLMRVGKSDGFTDHQAAVVRAAARLRIGKFKGHNRAMGPESGLSQTYVWGPKVKTYVRKMTYADAERLLATNSGHEFRIVGQPASEQPMALPTSGVRLMGAKEFTSVEALAGMKK